MRGKRHLRPVRRWDGCKWHCRRCEGCWRSAKQTLACRAARARLRRRYRESLEDEHNVAWGPCRQEAEAARREASEASQEAERLQGALREVRGVLAQRKADASTQSSQSAVVQALLAAKSAGEIPGIHGRLGEQTGKLSKWLSAFGTWQ